MNCNSLFKSHEIYNDILFLRTEPGYYEDGQFGIRIEDIVQIVPVEVESNFGGRGALTFKTVTMCPIQTKLINPSLLTEKEVMHDIRLHYYYVKFLASKQSFSFLYRRKTTLTIITRRCSKRFHRNSLRLVMI